MYKIATPLREGWEGEFNFPCMVTLKSHSKQHRGLGPSMCCCTVYVIINK